MLFNNNNDFIIGIVELHRGVIIAKSEGEGKGTEFSFEIPLVPTMAKCLVKPEDDHLLRNKSDSMMMKPPDLKNEVRRSSLHQSMTSLHHHPSSLLSLLSFSQQNSTTTSWFPRFSKFRKILKVHPLEDSQRSNQEISIAITFRNFLNHPVRLLPKTNATSPDPTNIHNHDNNNSNTNSSNAATTSPAILSTLLLADLENGLDGTKTTLEQSKPTFEETVTLPIQAMTESFIGSSSSWMTANASSLRTSSPKKKWKPPLRRAWSEGLKILLVDDSELGSQSEDV